MGKINSGLDMTNIYGTEEYKEQRAYAEPVFASEYKKETMHKVLPYGYTLKRVQYAGHVGGYNLHGTDNVLYNSQGEQVYHYQNINDDGEFATIISHANGQMYFIFRVDLYGYGVLDLQTDKVFIHIPREAETFIWIDVNYNQENNILAVSGCYWACPSGAVLLDFSDPMQQTDWFDLHEYLDNGFCLYDDIDFVRWENSTLYVKISDDSGTAEMAILPEQYMLWLNDKTVVLYRPVNQAELDLIKELNYQGFPPRLPEQPIFYPVLYVMYAVEIAENWNVPAYGAGFVLRFEVDASYMSQFQSHCVGAKYHEEYWIPAEELVTFNQNIVGPITVVREFYA